MKWFKHLSGSLDDPDISDAIEIFGADAYLVFFGILEIIAREFDEKNPGKCTISVAFLKKKLPISVKKTLKILDFYSERGRFSYQIYDGNRLEMLELSSNKFKTLADEYTLKLLRTNSGQAPENIRLEEEEEEEVDTLFSDEKRVTPTLKSEDSNGKKSKETQWDFDEAERWNQHVKTLFKTVKYRQNDWAMQIRLMRENDGLSKNEIANIRKYLSWERDNISKNDFRWCDQIGSPKKLRKESRDGGPRYYEKVISAKNKALEQFKKQQYGDIAENQDHQPGGRKI